MSQQSNPATLRDIAARLRRYSGNDEVHLVALNCATQLEAMAASGTEAAPSEILDALQRHVTSSESMRETFERTGDVKGVSMQAGITAGLLRAIEVVKNSAQAAASPEGEGREAFAAKIELGATDTLVGRREPGDTRTTFQRVADEISRLRELVRQSTAPSGGAALERLADMERSFTRIMENHPKGIVPADFYAGQVNGVRAAIQALEELAQESKTGAVTERRDGK